MLGLFLTLFTQQFIYQTDYTPQVKEKTVKELVIDEPAPIEVVLPPREEYNIACYCVSYARMFVKDLPRQDAKDFVANSNLQEGEIVILDYNGTRHVAVYEIKPEGLLVDEANFVPCKSGKRLIKWEELDKHLVGFYKTDINNLTCINKNMEEEKKEDVEEEVVDETPSTDENKPLEDTEDENGDK